MLGQVKDATLKLPLQGASASEWPHEAVSLLADLQQPVLLEEEILIQRKHQGIIHSSRSDKMDDAAEEAPPARLCQHRQSQLQRPTCQAS